MTTERKIVELHRSSDRQGYFAYRPAGPWGDETAVYVNKYTARLAAEAHWPGCEIIDYAI